MTFDKRVHLISIVIVTSYAIINSNLSDATVLTSVFFSPGTVLPFADQISLLLPPMPSSSTLSWSSLTLLSLPSSTLLSLPSSLTLPSSSTLLLLRLYLEFEYLNSHLPLGSTPAAWRETSEVLTF